MESSAREVQNGAKRSRNKNVARCGQSVDENRKSLNNNKLKQHQSIAGMRLLLEMKTHLEFAKFSECLEMKSEKLEFG